MTSFPSKKALRFSGFAKSHGGRLLLNFADINPVP